MCGDVERGCVTGKSAVAELGDGAQVAVELEKRSLRSSLLYSDPHFLRIFCSIAKPAFSNGCIDSDGKEEEEGKKRRRKYKKNPDVHLHLLLLLLLQPVKLQLHVDRDNHAKANPRLFFFFFGLMLTMQSYNGAFGFRRHADLSLSIMIIAMKAESSSRDWCVGGCGWRWHGAAV